MDPTRERKKKKPGLERPELRTPTPTKGVTRTATPLITTSKGKSPMPASKASSMEEELKAIIREKDLEIKDLKGRLDSAEGQIIETTKGTLASNIILELRPELEEVRDLWSRIKEMTRTLESHLADLQAKIESTERRPETYAERAKLNRAAPASAPKVEIRPARKIIRIVPSAASKIEATEVLTNLKASLNPIEADIRVRTVRATRQGAVVEVERQEDLDRILANSAIKAQGLVAEVPTRKGPRVAIYNLPKEVTQEEIRQAIARRLNETQVNNTMAKIRARNTERCHVVVDVDPSERETLTRQGISLGWEAYRVRDYVQATRCYKCQGFGHVAKYCRENLTCGHCAKEGHDFKSCPNTKRKPKCINCVKDKKMADHSCRADGCPAYQRAIQLEANRTNYGSP